MSTHCEHRPECPGCDILELSYEDQLAHKRERLTAALGHFPLLATIPVDPCVGTTQREAYRPRVKWAVLGARIGLYAEGHDVVDLPRCRTATAAAVAVADALRCRPLEGNARLVALDVRTAPDVTVPVLIVEAPTAEEARAHAEVMASTVDLPATGVAWSWRRPGAHSTLGGTPEKLRGEVVVHDRVGLVPAYFAPGSFSQAHAAQTARLHEHLRSLLGGLERSDRRHLVDLFAGTGGMGLALADLFERATLVESYAASAEAAERSARDLGLERTVRVIPAPAEKAVAELLARGDLILLDPPRTGLPADVLTAIVRLRPRHVVYVSCDPTTFARDLAVFASQGLRADLVVPFDLAPGTSQVEAVALLTLGEPPAPHIVARPDGLVVVEKPPFMPTTPNPEWPLSLQEAVRRELPRAQAAHRLDEGTSGLVALTVDGGAATALADYRKVYLALVRGVTRNSGTIRAGLMEGKRRHDAVTRYRRLEVVSGHSLVEVVLGTGRTHQIRRHMALIGHPVLGDTRYGDRPSNRHLALRHGLTRPFLHAARLEPVAASPLWPDLVATLESLRAAERRKR